MGSTNSSVSIHTVAGVGMPGCLPFVMKFNISYTTHQICLIHA
jgi:hypothetical protein